MTIYDVGDAPSVTGTFYDTNDVLTDPTTVTAELVEPDGTQTTIIDITNTSTGVYAANLPTIDQVGTHIVKFFGVGNLIAAEETRIEVRYTLVT